MPGQQAARISAVKVKLRSLPKAEAAAPPIRTTRVPFLHQLLGHVHALPGEGYYVDRSTRMIVEALGPKQVHCCALSLRVTTNLRLVPRSSARGQRRRVPQRCYTSHMNAYRQADWDASGASLDGGYFQRSVEQLPSPRVQEARRRRAGSVRIT